MARIRSIHPGIFTDEAFMMASPAARMLVIGIWTEAFDDGVFEWKPVVLKARLFPADAVNVDELLQELVHLRFVTSFSVNGKNYGAVRNFCRFQNPKKPNSSRVLSDELRNYVGLKADEIGTSGEEVRNQFGTGSEKSPQMERRGEKKEEKKEGGGALRHREPEREKPDPDREPANAPAAAAYDGLDANRIADQVCTALGPNADRTALGIASVKPILDLIRAGHDLDQVILPALRDASRKPRRDPIRSFELIARVVTDWIAKPPPASASVPEVREMVTLADHSRLAKTALLGFIERFRRDGVWLLDARTPPPGAPGCLIPQEFIPNDTELAS